MEVVPEDLAPVPIEQFLLEPNPFQSDVTIGFALPRAEAVRVDVFDIAGRLVRTLQRGQVPAGRRFLSWDGRNGSRQVTKAGVYLLRGQIGPRVFSGKVVRVR